jgi:tight adherence protein C
MLNTPPGPTVLGIDVILVGSLLAAVAAIAVMFAIYSAVTIRDPMAKRVKALNERREQLKAGIVKDASKRRQSLVRKNQTTDKMKETLNSRFCRKASFRISSRSWPRPVSARKNMRSR